ncbi:MAG TPA: protoporphyrinogen oxidase [Candidatus Binatia bacterium]|jgi:oxygen-dependent protoporphyrinogen oxidase|nr:protoporphyrinogen oxidase [Candidatus Binatia bacterium]
MNRRIVVVGGGISGLAAAYRLLELSREKNLKTEILLVEAGRCLGGVISTEQVGDFLVEGGPDSFISEKPWALRLCERLGIAARLISTNPTNQSLYVVHHGILQPLPEGFFLLAPTRLWPLARSPLFSWLGKLRMGLELFVPRGGNSDESLASFVRRRLGREVLERVAQPLVGGIYAADPEKLSLSATMPRFVEMERTAGSVIRAMWREKHGRQRGSGARWSLFVTLAGGMQELVDALASRFPTGTPKIGIKVKHLAWDATRKTWWVATDQGDKLEADGVILALPSHASAEILTAVSQELAQELKSIHYSSTATVSLAYRLEQIPSEVKGFGFVVPAVERRRIIACTFSSIKYSGRAPNNHLLFRVFVGDALRPELFEQDDATMEKTVRQELDMLLGVKAAPLFCRIYRHPNSMPQYQLGHLELLQRVEAKLEKFPTLALAGNAYRGVGIADCVHSGEEAAERLFQLIPTP